MNTDFERAKELGFGGNVVGFFPHTVDENGVIHLKSNAEIARALANDAAMATQPNIGAPAMLYTYLDPRVIETIYGVVAATKFFPKTKYGAWEDEFAQFPVEEITGEVGPYNDFGNGPTADVNYDFPVRQNFRYQVAIKYGDLETEKAARAKIPLASRKQLAAANIMGRAENKFLLYGVAGLNVRGMLNDPDLPTSISPISVSGKSTWADKVAAHPDQAANIIFNDVNKLWAELTTNNGGHLDVNSRIIVGISNKMISYLTIPNSFGKTAKAMLQENYSGMEFVQLPELSTAAGEMLYMVVPEIFGDETGFAAYNEAFNLGRLVMDMSAYRQKASAGTWGTIIRRPTAVATMTGI